MRRLKLSADKLRLCRKKIQKHTFREELGMCSSSQSSPSIKLGCSESIGFDLPQRLTVGLNLSSQNDEHIDIHVKALKELIFKGGDLKDFFKNKNKEEIQRIINGKINNGFSLLHYAVSADNLNAVEELICHGADVNAIGPNARRPLHQVESVHAAQILLRNGADIDAKDLRGKTVLYRAFILGEIDLVRFLLKNNADRKSLKTHGGLPDECDDDMFFKVITSRVRHNRML